MWKNKLVKMSAKRIFQFLPLVAVIGASAVIKADVFQQLLILAVFIWLQVFFIVEYFMPV